MEGASEGFLPFLGSCSGLLCCVPLPGEHSLSITMHTIRRARVLVAAHSLLLLLPALPAETLRLDRRRSKVQLLVNTAKEAWLEPSTKQASNIELPAPVTLITDKPLVPFDVPDSHTGDDQINKKRKRSRARLKIFNGYWP
ncbi:hypothetical protein NDU88_007947 [Pleurodeles waltl]|uniref:Uncharacterized protein n=1 Tax=Pleurodeles waltl TaxID=8319 RepID=A0AAV7QRG2_PLEWA|nr:hypothetical protein NDU88_007947 [Pleurodeles waltl]